MMMRGPSRDNGDTHNFREWQPQLPIHKCHHCPLRTRIEMKKSLLFYKGTGSPSHLHPARVRDNGDSPSRRILQNNGCAGWRSRLKIQAGCRPHQHTLPDPNDVDARWSANSPATSAEPAISAFIGGNEPSCSAKSEEADLRTPDLDDVVL
jgi:hypothetical protein